MAKGTELVKSAGGVLAGVDADMEEIAREAQALSGAGLSTERADNLIPFLMILQDNSPQVKKREGAYIEGAEPGMILRTDTMAIHQTLLFQPCFFVKKWNEWVPRDMGGGFVQSFDYDAKPKDAVQRPDNKNKWVIGDNDLVETRYHFGNVIGDDGQLSPAVIGMTSTMHKVSRQWMSVMNQFRVGGSAVAPTFFRGYELSTVPRKNAKGSWFIWKVEDRGWLNKPTRDAGQSLYEAVKSGEKQADTASMDADDGSDEGDDHAEGVV